MFTVYPLPRMEYRSLRDLREARKVALFTSAPAWDALGGSLDLPVLWRAEPVDATEELFLAYARELPDETEVIYAVGGGLPFDAAKFVASRRQLPLVGVPSALSTDAPWTPVSGVRRDGCVFYLHTGAPEKLYIDWEIISAAPPHVRATGFAEMAAIAIGLWDWRLAEERGLNPQVQRYVSYAAGVMGTMMQESLSIAARVGKGEIEALTQLLEMLALQVQLCSGLGHSRSQEGSEHYYAYSVENLTGNGLPHADLIGPGIVGMAAAQGQDPGPLREALRAVGVRLDRVSAENSITTLKGFSAYSKRHGLAYGIAHEFTSAHIQAFMNAVYIETP